jgi:hypothetical protein
MFRVLCVSVLCGLFTVTAAVSSPIYFRISDLQANNFEAEQALADAGIPLNTLTGFFESEATPSFNQPAIGTNRGQSFSEVVDFELDFGGIAFDLNDASRALTIVYDFEAFNGPDTFAFNIEGVFDGLPDVSSSGVTLWFEQGTSLTSTTPSFDEIAALPFRVLSAAIVDGSGTLHGFSSRNVEISQTPFTPTIAPVPLPASFGFLALGLGALAAVGARRERRSAA